MILHASDPSTREATSRGMCPRGITMVGNSLGASGGVAVTCSLEPTVCTYAGKFDDVVDVGEVVLESDVGDPSFDGR